jgi:hypothetical protein
MDVENLLTRLQKLRYFEGYSDTALAKATRGIRTRYAAGLAGPWKAEFERFPGLALVVTDVDMELDSPEDLRLVLRQFASDSCGMFAPKSIRARRVDGDGRYQLQFTVNGDPADLSCDAAGWLPEEFLEGLRTVTKKNCSGLVFQDVEYPDPGQSGYFLWCTPRARKAVARAGLIPSDQNPLNAQASSSPTRKPAKSQPALDTEPTFAPPADRARAERMGLFRKAGWRIPSLSQATVRTWKELTAAPVASAVGEDLTKQIQRTFDLLCARHCGLSGMGDPAALAKKVVQLVDRYLFGSWRVGHVEEGVKFTEAKARKLLLWWSELQRGCATAVSLGDQKSLRKFLEYPRYDIYDEYVEDELAYYRLLSDVVLGRNEFDWVKQTALIEQGRVDRLPKLLRALAALRDHDATAFRNAILKFATRPKHTPPVMFHAVVDCDVTLLVALAHQKGIPCDDFPPYLQDKVLDNRIL